jgi:hypothetical protein
LIGLLNLGLLRLHNVCLKKDLIDFESHSIIHFIIFV